MAEQFDPHYEEKFEYPLMKLIREKAEEDDISIIAATKIVLPGYALALGWRDEEGNEALRQQQADYIAAHAKDSLLMKLKDKKLSDEVNL